MTEILDLLQCKLGYTFNNKSLLAQAVTHRSYGGVHNERLEFLGDAVLDLLIGEFLYHVYPAAAEGDLSHMRARVVCGDSLAEIGQQLHLGDCLFLGAGEEKSGGRQRESSLANAVEALIAAVYLDGGMDSCRTIVRHLFVPILQEIEQVAVKDAKTQLQEYLQSRQLMLPLYTLLAKAGDDHNATFTMECSVSALDLRADAVGSSRKKAEQLAAAKIMKQLKH